MMSRCKEKGSGYSAAAHRYVLQNAAIEWSRVAHFVAWSDGGRHFRSAAGISSLLVRSLEFICRLGGFAQIAPNATCVFGTPPHFKNACDGQQAVLWSMLAEASKSEVVSDIRGLMSCFRRLYESSSASSCRMRAHWHDFFPDSSKSDFCAKHMWQFTSASFLEPITVSQSYMLRLNDIRRRSAPLYTNAFNQMAAVKFSSLLLPGRPAAAGKHVCPHWLILRRFRQMKQQLLQQQQKVFQRRSGQRSVQTSMRNSPQQAVRKS